MLQIKNVEQRIYTHAAESQRSKPTLKANAQSQRTAAQAHIQPLNNKKRNKKIST